MLVQPGLSKIGMVAVVLAGSCYTLVWYFLGGTQQERRPVPLTAHDTKSLPKAAELDDILITIKTSKKFYKSRLDVILKTWFKNAKDQVYTITDDDDPEFQKKTGNKLVTSKCGTTHGLRSLCCKVGLTFDTFMAHESKRWWCSVDDDNYVHVDRLLQFLGQFDWKEPTYIGRRSRPSIKSRYKNVVYDYQFGTGGAGFCISHPLAERMKPWCSITSLPDMCQEVGAADDCVIGFVITELVGVNLTESMILHSHFEVLKDFSMETLDEQITFSYRGENVLDLSSINPKFDTTVDPTRFMSLHCHLYPNDDLCHTAT